MGEAVVYTLELEGKRFYVGKTCDLERRLDDHYRGGSRASAWTRKYPVVRLAATIPCRNDFDELRVTLDMMRKHGIYNVRGASYLDVVLSPEQVADIRRHLATANNSCFRCGARDHFAAQCESNRQQQGSFSSNNWGPRSLGCQRCGRTSHSIHECYASFDASGRPIRSSACANCGSSSHSTVDCGETANVNYFLIFAVFAVFLFLFAIRAIFSTGSEDHDYYDDYYDDDDDDYYDDDDDDYYDDDDYDTWEYY